MRSYRTLSRLVRILRRPLSQDILLPELQGSFSTLLELERVNYDSSFAVVLGRFLLLLVAFTIPAGVRAEEALTGALERFFQQVEQVETYLVDKGKDWPDLSEEEERALWENI
jgi:uncharacterized protein YabN with tetrapyrrole methylase and pyrophosphatase domain